MVIEGRVFSFAQGRRSRECVREEGGDVGRRKQDEDEYEVKKKSCRGGGGGGEFFLLLGLSCH